MFLDFYDEIDLSLQFKGIPAPLEMLLYRQSQWWLSPAGTILARSTLKLISFLQQCDCEIIIIIIIACHDHYHHHHYHQVMVDWSKIVKNAQCVDKFVVWMWWVSFSRFYIHISSWWTTHDYLFEIQKQSRPDGTERIGKSAVSKEVAHSILPSFEYCNEENWKESLGVKDYDERHHGYGGLRQLQVVHFIMRILFININGCWGSVMVPIRWWSGLPWNWTRRKWLGTKNSLGSNSSKLLGRPRSWWSSWISPWWCWCWWWRWLIISGYFMF